jgi:hypothetical protein
MRRRHRASRRRRTTNSSKSARSPMSRSDSFGTACASVEVIVTQTYFDRRSAPPPARSRASCSAPTRQRFLTTLGHAPGRYPCGVPKIASCLQIADFSGAHRVLVPHRGPADRLRPAQRCRGSFSRRRRQRAPVGVRESGHPGRKFCVCRRNRLCAPHRISRACLQLAWAGLGCRDGRATEGVAGGRP